MKIKNKKYKHCNAFLIISMVLSGSLLVMGQAPNKNKVSEKNQDAQKWEDIFQGKEDIDDPVLLPKKDKRRIKGVPLIKNGKPIIAKISKKELLAEGKVVPLNTVIDNDKIDQATMRRSMFIFLLDKLKKDSLEVSLYGIPLKEKELIYSKTYLFSSHYEIYSDDKAPDYKIFWTKITKCLMIQDYLMHHKDIYWQTKAFDAMQHFLLMVPGGATDASSDHHYKFSINELRNVVYCASELYFVSKLHLAKPHREDRARTRIITAYDDMKISEDKLLDHYNWLYENSNGGHKNHWVIISAKYYLSIGDKKTAREWINKYNHEDNIQQKRWVDKKLKELTLKK